ncbi:unnamed protein product [marine sediment metagenome]|uniref:Uncharacterized protein n=1 Tax=marine sediment metagenome TaxID=412755 RepID=X0YVD0_9ZZZZ
MKKVLKKIFSDGTNPSLSLKYPGLVTFAVEKKLAEYKKTANLL